MTLHDSLMLNPYIANFKLLEFESVLTIKSIKNSFKLSGRAPDIFQTSLFLFVKNVFFVHIIVRQCVRVIHNMQHII